MSEAESGEAAGGRAAGVWPPGLRGQVDADGREGWRGSQPQAGDTTCWARRDPHAGCGPARCPGNACWSPCPLQSPSCWPPAVAPGCPWVNCGARGPPLGSELSGTVAECVQFGMAGVGGSVLSWGPAWRRRPGWAWWARSTAHRGSPEDSGSRRARCAQGPGPLACRVCVLGVCVCSPLWATSHLTLTWERRGRRGAPSRGSGPPSTLAGAWLSQLRPIRWPGLRSSASWEQPRGQQAARPQGGSEARGVMGRGWGGQVCWEVDSCPECLGSPARPGHPLPA